MYDAIILSDLHLGSSNCQAKNLVRFFESLADLKIATATLILNGDVFNSFDFRRLQKNHWRVLSLLRKLSDQIEIIWICGNHDGSAEIVSHLLGVTVKDEHELCSGGRKILILHGHIFDDFIDAHPVLTWLGDMVYFFLQWIDRSHYFAKLAKNGSKIFLRCAEKIKHGSIEYAHKKNCQAVCCGHTHQAACDLTQPTQYFNSGCWTETPCTYLTVADGCIELQPFDCRAGEDSSEEVVDAVSAE